jgi:hypothetical protein
MRAMYSVSDPGHLHIDLIPFDSLLMQIMTPDHKSRSKLHQWTRVNTRVANAVDPSGPRKERNTRGHADRWQGKRVSHVCRSPRKRTFVVKNSSQFASRLQTPPRLLAWRLVDR